MTYMTESEKAEKQRMVEAMREAMHVSDEVEVEETEADEETAIDKVNAVRRKYQDMYRAEVQGLKEFVEKTNKTYQESVAKGYIEQEAERAKQRARGLSELEAEETEQLLKGERLRLQEVDLTEKKKQLLKSGSQKQYEELKKNNALLTFQLEVQYADNDRTLEEMVSRYKAYPEILGVIGAKAKVVGDESKRVAQAIADTQGNNPQAILERAEGMARLHKATKLYNPSDFSSAAGNSYF